MHQNQNVFQKNRKLFFEQLISVWSKSPDYAGIGNDLDAILLLADRILAACQEDLEFNRVLNITEHLDELSKGTKTTKVAEDILEDIELWLRVILNLAKPSVWQTRRIDTHYTLAHLIREDLNLLLQMEISLDVDSYHQISDPINQLIFLAYRYRNPLTHSPRDHSDIIKAHFLPASLCTLIVPVYKYKKEIQEALSGLIVSPFTSTKHINMLSLINSERQKHLISFRGRDKWLSLLKQKLTVSSDKPKPYILLNGYEGMGKSALVAKITEELSANAPTIGRNAGLVRKTAPWLPSVIIHFGKQSNQPYEIIDLLLAQINTLLLEPIDIEQVRISLDEFSHKELPRLGKLIPEKSSFSSLKAVESQSSYALEKPYTIISSQDISFDPFKSEAYDFTLYRRVLYLALERVVKEKGSVILIIDAIDEGQPRWKQFTFFARSVTHWCLCSVICQT